MVPAVTAAAAWASSDRQMAPLVRGSQRVFARRHPAGAQDVDADDDADDDDGWEAIESTRSPV